MKMDIAEVRRAFHDVIHRGTVEIPCEFFRSYKNTHVCYSCTPEEKRILRRFFNAQYVEKIRFSKNEEYVLDGYVLCAEWVQVGDADYIAIPEEKDITKALNLIERMYSFCGVI